VNTAYLTHPIFKEHDTGPQHPERAARLEAIEAALAEQPWAAQLQRLSFGSAPDEAILRCHSPEHLSLIRDLAEQGGGPIDRDTYVSHHSHTVAKMAAGAALRAVDVVMNGTARNAFVAARPPGHHAETARAMGFCLFNNIAIAARHAQAVHGLRRIAIVDWDVHHGNGTQEIFYEDPKVFFASVHEWGIYPHTGRNTERGAGVGYGATVNYPLPAGSRGDKYAAIWNRLGFEIDDFGPDLILVSAGFDAHERDPLAHMELQAGDFAHLMRQTRQWAEQHCQGRLVCLLEGGYDLQGLSESVVAVLEVLLHE
jgi:acetoin utilization deacetylase AcuC-like enzyme